MNRKFIVVMAAGLIGVLSLFTLGCEMCCNSSQGNGTIIVADSGTVSHKVSFSYRVECVGTNDPAAPRKVKGHLEYRDFKPWKQLGTAKAETVNVAFHGVVEGVASTDVLTDDIFGVWDATNSVPLDAKYQAAVDTDQVCAQNPNVALFTGTYTPHPNPLGEAGKGKFIVAVQDNGKPGPSPDDIFIIKLEGGAYPNYAQKGALASGNIKQL